MAGKDTRTRRIDAKLPATGAEVTLGESVEDVAPPAQQVREKPENLTLASALVRSAVTPEAQISATWDSPPNGLAVDQYVIQISTDSSFPDDATTTRFTTRDQPSATITGLATNTAYYVRVAAIVRAVYSEWTDTETETTPADTVQPGPVTSAATDFTGPDLLITWTNPTDANLRNVRVDIYASNGGALLRTLYSSGGSAVYPYDQNKLDSPANGDPSLYVTLHAVSHGNVDSTQVALSPTNAAPSAPTVAGVVGFSQILATVTSTPPTDFDVYEFVWKNSGGATVRTAYTKAASDTLPASSSDTYSVEVRVRDVFQQYSTVGTATGLTVDVLTIADLRSRIVYSDSLSTAAATLKAALADDNRSSGGVSYASNASWVRSIRADWQLQERIKTITLSMTPASGTTNWYIRTSIDGTTWSYFAGPVTSSYILTSVADASAAQAAAVSAATLGGPSTSRVNLPSLTEVRYVEVWLRNTATSTRVDEFYPRRFIQSDDIEAESIKAINIAAATITGDRIAANTITAGNIQADTITASEIAANAITASELAAGSVTATKISVSTLSAITADMGSLTAGSIVIGSTNKIWLNDSADGALNIGGSTKASAPFRVTAAGALTATNATITGTVNFGGGEGILDANGLRLIAATNETVATTSRSLLWRRTSLSGDLATWIQGAYISAQDRNIMTIEAEQSALSTGGLIYLIAEGSPNSQITLSAGTSSASSMSLAADTVSVFGDQTIEDRLVIGGTSSSDLTTRLALRGTDGSYSAGPHAEFITAADAHPQLQILPYTHDNITISFDAHFDGTNWKSSDAGSNFQIGKGGDLLLFRYKAGVAAGSNITWSDAMQIDSSGNTNVVNALNIGTAAGTTAGAIAGTIADAGTTNVVSSLTLAHNSSATPGVGFGVDLAINLNSSTTDDTNAALIRTAWITATHASRAARLTMFAYDTAARNCLSIQGSGTAAMIGFLGATPVARQSVTALSMSVGTGDNTIADVGAAFSQTTLNNNFRDVGEKINEIRTVLVNYGLL